MSSTSEPPSGSQSDPTPEPARELGTDTRAAAVMVTATLVYPLVVGGLVWAALFFGFLALG